MILVLKFYFKNMEKYKTKKTLLVNLISECYNNKMPLY